MSNKRKYKLRVLIRCDSDQNIGMGHAMRSLALAQQLTGRKHLVILAYKSMPANILAGYEKNGVKLCALGPNIDMAGDAGLTVNTAIENDLNWIILDGYQFDAQYQAEIKKAGFKLLIIDDMVRAEGRADILLNQNPGFNKKDFKNYAAKKILLGAKYILLRKEILKAGRKASISKKLMLLTMGGADPDNFTTVFLRALRPHLPGMNLKIRVLVGEANKHASGIKEMARDERIKVLISPPDYFRQLAKCDLAIHAAGSTSWELAFLGIPGLCYILADNQIAVAKALNKTGSSINMGWARDFNSDLLIKKIKALLNDRKKLRIMSQKGRRLVDGNGAQRVVREIEHATI